MRNRRSRTLEAVAVLLALPFVTVALVLVIAAATVRAVIVSTVRTLKEG